MIVYAKWFRQWRFLEVISGRGGNFEICHGIAFNFRILHYTIISNNVHPNKIVKIPTKKRQSLDIQAMQKNHIYCY